MSKVWINGGGTSSARYDIVRHAEYLSDVFGLRASVEAG
jgi:hypothetical protein